MTGTYSLSFIFVLIGVEELTLAETILIACSSMVVQCIWRPAERPLPVQILFNVAAAAMSVAISFSAARSVQLPHFAGELIVQLMLAAAVYYVTNTLLVSGVLALMYETPLGEIWSQWFRWSLRYYVVGFATALVIVAASRYVGWMFSLLVLPVMYVEYLCLHLNIRSQEPRREPF